MTKTLTRVYSDYASADLAVRELKTAGLGDSHIGIVASNADGWHKPGGSDVDPKHDKDRDGKEGEFPLVSVSLAIIDCNGSCSVGEVARRAAEMKKFAKSRPGNVFVRDRRSNWQDIDGEVCTQMPAEEKVA